MSPERIVLILIIILASVVTLTVLSCLIGRWLARVSGRLDVPDGNEDHL